MLKKAIILIVIIISIALFGALLLDLLPKSDTAEKKATKSITENPNEADLNKIVNAPEEKPMQKAPKPAAETLSFPEMTINKEASYSAVLHTNKGDITISLNADKTPATVNNFIYLAKNKFYDNTIFHRVLKGFMIQGGDPKGDGTGGPGYKFADEPIEESYSRGVVAMANSGPNTNGSQFFILHNDYSLLPNYVIFGKVSKGIEVVDAIAEDPVEAGFSGEVSKPITPSGIISIDIIETRID